MIRQLGTFDPPVNAIREAGWLPDEGEPMSDPRARRQARQHLADRLILEYAGAVPAGQVLAAVLRAEQLLQAYHPDEERRMSLCEELVRHRLAECTTRHAAPRLASAT